MFRAALRSVLARKVRLLLTGVAVILGVAFVAGTYILTDTMTRAFDELIATGYAEIDVIVRRENAFTAQTSPFEERESMPESVIATVEGIPGVQRAVGDVLGYAQIVNPDTGDVIGGFAPTFAASWNELAGFTIQSGSAPRGEAEVTIDSGTAEANGISVGDRIQILFEGPPGEFEVVGTATYGEEGSLFGATYVLFDLPTAQRVLGREGQLDTISVVGEEGDAGQALAQQVAEELPQGIEAVPASTVVTEQQDQVGQNLGILRTAFLVFGFVALFVGAFIIFNTFAITVAQRTRELALFRALGATGRQVMGSVVIEAVVVGLLASAAGVVLGIGLAVGLRGLLSAIGVDLPASGTVIQLRTIVVSILVGTIVTAVAAIVPARRAARVAPVEALREGQDRPGRSLRFRLISGVVVLALGIAPLLYGLFGNPDDALTLVGIGVAITFIGVAMLSPLIARPVAAAIGAPVRTLGVPGKLARENAMRNPRRTAATASALMIGLGLVVFVAVFGASARASTTVILERTLRSDFIVTSPTFTGFSVAAADEIRAVQGVATVSEVRQAEAKVDGGTVFVTGIDPATFATVSELGVVEGDLTRLEGAETIAVHEDVADSERWGIGDTVVVDWPSTGRTELEVALVYSENGLIGDWATSLETYDANVAQRLDLFALVKVESGADVGAIRTDLEAALAAFPNVEVQDQTQFREMYATFLNQILNIVTAMLLFAVLIALFGVMNTLYLSIHERTRELGLLRAVGLTRRQTRAMVRREAGIIAVMGALFGIVIGIAFGWALQRALEPEGFTELGIPGVQLAIYVALAALFGWLFAVFPARRAARLNVLEAIAYE
jgi:putative ABC transport system permease protein